MRKLFLAALFGLSATFSSAQTVALDSPEFGEAVRAYLMENPQVIMEAVAVLQQREAEAEAQNDLTLVQDNYDDIFYDGYSHVAGNPDGTILMVEFQDYKCGYCKRAHPEIQQLLADNDDIRLVIKEFPILGEESVLASRGAVAVLINESSEVYETMNDSLMRFNGPITEDILVEIADAAGADSARMLEMMNTPIVTQVIQSNRILGQRLQISGTPTFVVADQMLRGYLPLASMQALIDETRQALN